MSTVIVPTRRHLLLAGDYEYFNASRLILVKDHHIPENPIVTDQVVDDLDVQCHRTEIIKSQLKSTKEQKSPNKQVVSDLIGMALCELPLDGSDNVWK
ncbi:hypothetical protein KSP40_PGU020237 [Platanthera guangdongensis]|uniref:Uncharacterized protein n=1 Tax=Platanthera guangdongensis TaxID=2320717 RepID=A0ABR2M192_9ASPA